MAKSIDGRRLLKSNIGRTITTFKGDPNTILRIEDDSVIVGTARSPKGTPALIEGVQLAIKELREKGKFLLKDNTRRTQRKSCASGRDQS
jgi:hypothetical protein